MSSAKNIPKSVFDVTVTDLYGKPLKLDKFKGKCLLIVNIASECQLMKQNFALLRQLKKKFSNGKKTAIKIQNSNFVISDLAILLFPCNQFMGMPQKDSLEILSFLHQESVDFAETFSMIDVNGSETSPLFQFLKSERPGCISWNYSKFLVSKCGHQVERFSHRILFQSIESEIKRMV